MAVSVRKIVSSGLSFWVLVTVIGLYFLIHLHKFINFGIDLVGGTYITLEVHVDKALEYELADRVSFVINRLKKNQMAVPTSQKFEGHQSILVFENSLDASEAGRALRDMEVHLTSAQQDNNLILTIPVTEKQMLEHDAVQGNINVLRTRLDQFGVGEITIAAQGERNIIVELPNVHNPQQAKAMIGKAALLEFKLVEDSADTEEHLLSRYGGVVPEGMIVLPGKGRKKMYYLLPNYAEITGRMLRDARMDFGGRLGYEPVVKFSLKAEGGEKFYELSGQNLGKQLAVIIDDIVITAPVLQAAISTDGEITGDFTSEEAQELAMLLKSGAFVAPVTFEEERHIGPSLGQESIRQGLISCIIGLSALLVFSCIVYKLAGLFAFIVLLYNLLLILFAMAWLGAALTLPGIAGMILTIGMAIDASILIYERIREELSHGSPLRKSINEGFSHAMAVILDANITHFLVALVLYKLGAGPIQGFAVTMIIGIASTLITGLLLLRSILNFYVDVLGIQKLKI